MKGLKPSIRLVPFTAFVIVLCPSLVCPTSDDVEFIVRKIPQDKVYLPGYRMEHAERNTSKEYDYWKQMDINWIEWPGNITKLEVKNPIVKWGKRAKLLEYPCNVALGLNFKAYAYKYLHLTWGPFRLTSSYCPPLKIPRSLFKKKLSSSTPFISATDFEFVSDALLIILESKVIVSIGRLEASHLNEGSPTIPYPDVLSYTLATGLRSPITKLVTQNCCKNRMTKTCIHGDTVLAYQDGSRDATVFISIDSGTTFKPLVLKSLSSTLRSALNFPETDLILTLHGDQNSLSLGRFSLTNGEVISSPKTASILEVQGEVQMKRIGEEASILIWDECKAWYSNNTGLNVSEALFYVHDTIQKEIDKELKVKKSEQKHMHKIKQKHCYLGGASAFGQDASTGKIGILDNFNNFFYGIDTKTSFFPLIGTMMDMTLLLPGKKSSITPGFDFNNRPKLMYPPRYLWSDDPAYKDKNYKKRLGIRLFPRSVFPSDFMPPFFEEHIPKRLKKGYGLQKCQTSSIIIDASLTQKPKIFYTEENSPFNFTVEFKSFSNDSSQLHMEPNYLSKYLKILILPIDFMRLGAREYYYFKYNVTVLPKPIAFTGNLFRLNLFTKKSIRCVHQPQVTVWIRIHKEKEDQDNPITFSADPEPINQLRNFLNSTSIRKVLRDNPANIKTCSAS